MNDKFMKNYLAENGKICPQCRTRTGIKYFNFKHQSFRKELLQMLVLILGVIGGLIGERMDMGPAFIGIFIGIVAVCFLIVSRLPDYYKCIPCKHIFTLN